MTDETTYNDSLIVTLPRSTMKGMNIRDGDDVLLMGRKMRPSLSSALYLLGRGGEEEEIVEGGGELEGRREKVCTALVDHDGIVPTLTPSSSSSLLSTSTSTSTLGGGVVIFVAKVVKNQRSRRCSSPHERRHT